MQGYAENCISQRFEKECLQMPYMTERELISGIYLLTIYHVPGITTPGIEKGDKVFIDTQQQ
jgi:hypothetical protein